MTIEFDLLTLEYEVEMAGAEPDCGIFEDYIEHATLTGAYFVGDDVTKLEPDCEENIEAIKIYNEVLNGDYSKEIDDLLNEQI